MKKIVSVFLIIATVLLARGYSIKGFKSSKPRFYSRGGSLYLQRGYIKKSTGKFVIPHLKTRPDNYLWNNLGF